MASVSVLRGVLAGLSNSDQEVATSLIDQAERRGLSPKQAVLVERLVLRAITPKPDLVNVLPLVDFMRNAAVKHPVLVLNADGTDIRLYVSGPASRAPGYIVVTSTERTYPERKFFGRISPTGDFEPSALEPEIASKIVAALKEMALDPALAAAKHGKLTGWCCFCRLPLSDARSLAVGYGRLCARKWGLPYGIVITE